VFKNYNYSNYRNVLNKYKNITIIYLPILDG